MRSATAPVSAVRLRDGEVIKSDFQEKNEKIYDVHASAYILMTSATGVTKIFPSPISPV